MSLNPKTQFLTNDPATRKKWAKDLFKVLLPALEYNTLVGTGNEAPIQLRTELAKGEGDEITFSIRLPLSGEGRVGNDEVEGNEEKLSFRNFKMTIEELNHAVDTGGRMEEQRVPFNLMTEAKDGLQYWWAEKLSDALIAHLVGDTSFLVAGKTFAQAPTAPDVYHYLGVNQADNTAVATVDAAITSADVLDLTFLDRLKQRAELPNNTNCFKLRPFMKGGKKYFKVLMHPYVFDQLRQNTNIGQWGDLLRAANKLQEPQVEIEYNGLLIMKSERIPQMVATDSSGGVYRTVLMGAQAACFAWGGAGESKSTVMSFVPYKKDAERFVCVRGGGIWGIKKTQFRDGTGSTYYDYGCVVGASYASPLT